jgi:hypothetical protein
MNGKRFWNFITILDDLNIMTQDGKKVAADSAYKDEKRLVEKR